MDDPRRHPVGDSPEVAAFKLRPEYQAAGIVQRQNMLVEEFGETYLAETAAHLESIAYPDDGDSTS